MQKIALLGLGKMGTGIALSILRSGYQLTVWNRTKEKARTALDAGAIWADSPAKAAMQADAVIAMVSDDTASKEIWLGTHAVLNNLVPGTKVIECSTLSLGWVHTLSAAAKQKELIYIDCPVTGIPAAAAAGQLTLLVGAAADDLTAIMPLLESFSKTIRSFGAVGAGTSYKLMINLMGAVQIAALAEGIAMAARLGLDMETVIDTIESSAAASPQVMRYARSMGTKAFSTDPAFTVALRLKDARYALDLARSINLPAKLGAAAFDWFDAASEKYADADEANVINLVE